MNGSGKAEVQLPGGVNVVMRGRGAGVVGSESRREPDFFFMTVSQITRTVDTPLPLPRVIEGDRNSTTATLTINLTEQGKLIVAGEAVTKAEVLARLERRLADTDGDPGQTQIQIRVHRQCRSGYVTELLQPIAELGFTRVRSAITLGTEGDE